MKAYFIENFKSHLIFFPSISILFLSFMTFLELFEDSILELGGIVLFDDTVLESEPSFFNGLGSLYL